MPFNLGGFAQGLTSGIDTGHRWADRSDQQYAQEILGRTLQNLGVYNQPQLQPPMPGQASVPNAPPPNISPMSFAAQPGLAGGVAMPGGGPVPPSFGRNVAPSAGVPLSPQPMSFPPNAPPPPSAPYAQGGGGMQPQIPTPSGGWSIDNVASTIYRSNPELNPNDPSTARRVFLAAQMALPFAQEHDRAQSMALTNQREGTRLGMERERLDLSKSMGEERLGIARERAQSADERARMLMEVQAQKLKQAEERHAQNLEFNKAKLEEAKRRGDLSAQRMIETQLEHDRMAKIQATNALANLYRSVPPDQLEGMQGDIQSVRAAGEKPNRGGGAEPSGTSLTELKNKYPNFSFQPVTIGADGKGVNPQPGQVHKGHVYVGGDPNQPSSWVKFQ